MTEPIIRAAGYVRVSSKEQVDGQSLTTQRDSIKTFLAQHSYELTEIYADEGISGGTVKDRPALLRLLRDAELGKFSILVIHRLSRFGRNAREILENHDLLSKKGIELKSISEGIDFGSRYGKAMLGMLSVIAELERDIIKETLLENRIASAQHGTPTSGSLPFGRTFDKENNQWLLDETVAKYLQWAAQEYISGQKLTTITEQFNNLSPQKLTLARLLFVLKNRCGDKWEMKFDNESPITLTVPRILSDETIELIHQQASINHRVNRTDISDPYLLSGFLKCDKCGAGIVGQTQIYKGKRQSAYRYYVHQKRNNNCTSFSVMVEKLDEAVMRTIFENFVDVPSFEKAISDSLPDDKLISDLHEKIQMQEKEINKVSLELEKLVNLALDGTLRADTIKKKEKELLEKQNTLQTSLHEDLLHLQSLPDIETMKSDANTVRRELLEKYSGGDRLNEMTFEEKRNLLKWFFSGKDNDGKEFGIYISKRGQGKSQMIDYFMYGKIVGMRTLYGDIINYMSGDNNIISPLKALKCTSLL